MTPSQIAEISFWLILITCGIFMALWFRRIIIDTKRIINEPKPDTDISLAKILNDNGEIIHSFLYDGCDIKSDNTTEFTLNDEVVCWVPNTYIVVIESPTINN